MRFAPLALVLAPALAHANMAKSTRGGEPTGELRGTHDIAIASEQLDLDLRPLSGGDGNAKIVATYHLANAGESRTLPLVFVTGVRAASMVVVTLDGVRLATAPTNEGLPVAWAPPKTTPDLDGTRAYAYELEARDAVALGFTATVPAGGHELRVAYSAEPMTVIRPHDSPTRLYQLAYVLAPAREWASFGTLDATIEVPSNWRIAVTPAFTRDGDVLRAHFTGVPADAIEITASARVGVMFHVLNVAGPLLVLLVLVGGGALLWRRGAAQGRGARLKSAGGWLFGLVWGALLFGAFLVWIFAAEATIEAGQEASRGYAPGFAAIGAFLLAVIAWPVGALLVRLGWKRGVHAIHPGP